MLAGANADRTDGAPPGRPRIRSCRLSEESGSAFSRRQPTQRNRFAERGVAVTADEAYFVIILPDEVDASGTIVAVEAGCESEPPRGGASLIPITRRLFTASAAAAALAPPAAPGMPLA